MKTEILIGGLFACSIVGTLVFNYLIVRKTESPLERRFMIRASVVAWVSIIFFAVLDSGLPSLHWAAGMGAIFVFAFTGVRAKQIQIRRGRGE